MIEQQVAEDLRKQGYTVYTKGWPDLIAIKPGERPIIREVKGPGDSVRPNQQEILRILAANGLDAKFFLTASKEEVLEFSSRHRRVSLAKKHKNRIAVPHEHGGYYLGEAFSLDTFSWVREIRCHKQANRRSDGDVRGFIHCTPCPHVNYSVPRGDVRDAMYLSVRLSGPKSKISESEILGLAENGAIKSAAIFKKDRGSSYLQLFEGRWFFLDRFGKPLNELH